MTKTNKVYIMTKKEQFGNNAKRYAHDKRYLAEETVIERAYFRGCEFGFWDGVEETMHAVDSFREGMLYAFNKYGCWQPGSEQPDEDGEYLVLTVWGPTKDMPFYAKFENGEWSIPQVKWWIKKPNINDWEYVNNKED